MDAAARTRVYEELHVASWAARRGWADTLRPDLERARYKLGTGLADRILPYVLDDDLLRLFRAAVTELILLYIGRNRAFVGEDVHERLLLTHPQPVAALRPPAYQPPEAVKTRAMREAMVRAPRVLAGMDCGLLASWWGTGGKGRELLAGWTALQVQASEEMGTDPGGEQTPYLLQFALLRAYREADSVLEALQVPEGVRPELQAAALLGLHLTHLVVCERVLEHPVLAGRRDDTLRTRWRAVLNPAVSFQAAPRSRSICRFYPVRVDLMGSRGKTFTGLLRDEGPEPAAAALRTWLGDRGFRRRLTASLALEQLGEALLQVLADAPASDSEAARFCRAHLRQSASLTTLLQEKKARRNTARMIEATAGPGDSGVRAAEAIRRYDPGAPAKGLGTTGQIERRLGRSLIADAGDRIVAEAVQTFMPGFSHRTGQESDRALEDEYEAGRLYRFGLSVSPFLRGYQRAADVGHYFIDIKDYTRRTAMLKEDIMADFIRREFYEPVLAIARAYHHGLQQLGDRGGVHLNNLPGDAVSLSGDIVSLVGITRAIRSHLDTFAARLSDRLGQAAIAERVDEVEQHITRALQRLAEQADARERARLETEREMAIGRITGQALSAGSYIAFGSAPAVIVMEDPVWGRVHVSIAEKINESARGTARHPAAQAAVQAYLEHRRRQTGNPALALPFRVYVHTDAGGAAVLYNAGDALSGEALAAYRAACARETAFVEIRLPVAELDPAITGKFAFLEPALYLVAGTSGGREVPELFRYAGTIVFRGFASDRPSQVWELVNPDDPFGRSLARSESFRSRLATGPATGQQAVAPNSKSC